MSYNKVYFVKVQERSLTNPRVLKFQFPNECFSDYREARKSLEEETQMYAEHFGYEVERDECIEDLYSICKDGVKMAEMSIDGIILR